MTSYCCNELKHVHFVQHHMYITTTACLWSVYLTEPSVYLFLLYTITVPAILLMNEAVSWWSECVWGEVGEKRGLK